MRFIFVKILFICCLGLSLQGCETLKNLDFSSSEKPDEYVDWDSERFYEEAKKAMAVENYLKAIELYQTLESRYPFGKYAAQTQLDIAYAYYKNGDADAGLAAVERFMKINPRNPNMDYAYYLKGLINFNRDLGFLYRYIPTDNTQRDPSKYKESYANFEDLIRLYPKSQYIPDAEQRLVALRDYMARSELNVANFYMKRRAYMAAVNRAGKIVDECQTNHPAPCTPAVPYALQVMEKAYMKLGLDDLASKSRTIYQQNYPNGAPIDINQNTRFVEDIWDFIGLDED